MAEREKSIEEKRAFLREAGFFTGVRDPRVNTRYPGAFMVADACFEEQIARFGGSTPDASRGPWCIVGDDLDLLVGEAYDWWSIEAEGRAP